MQRAKLVTKMLERVAALIALAALTAPSALSANLERGRALYENHCQVCHSSKVHRREHRIALNAQELNGIVARWQQEEKLGWSREDIDDVVTYLRSTEYRY